MKTRNWLISLEVEPKYVNIKHSNDYKTCNLCLASLIEHQKRCLLNELSSALNPSSSKCSDLNIRKGFEYLSEVTSIQHLTERDQPLLGHGMDFFSSLVAWSTADKPISCYWVITFCCCSPLTFLVDTLISRCKRLL